MEHQPLIAPPNDDGGKKKNGAASLLVKVSTTVLLLVLVFYGGVYRHRLGCGRTKQTRGSVVGADGVIPIGGDCYDHRDNCAIPLGFQHGVCACVMPHHCGLSCECTTGQPGAWCAQTSDCVVPPELDHAVCREDKCQSGEPGASCGVHDDCVVITDLDQPHAVCRDEQCQSGQSGARCEKDSECVAPTNFDHGVCRGPTKRCQR